MQEEIHRAAYAAQVEIESGERPVVGVNVNAEGEGAPRIGQPDYSALERTQKAALAERKTSRDAARWPERCSASGKRRGGRRTSCPPSSTR